MNIKLDSLHTHLEGTSLSHSQQYERTLNVYFTARKRSCGKVMFLHLSVSHSVYRGVPGQVSPPGQVHPPAVHAGIRSTSGRYASYWNAFLFFLPFRKEINKRRLVWIVTPRTTSNKTQNQNQKKNLLLELCLMDQKISMMAGRYQLVSS